jgi:hypothetical protein
MIEPFVALVRQDLTVLIVWQSLLMDDHQIKMIKKPYYDNMIQLKQDFNW